MAIEAVDRGAFRIHGEHGAAVGRLREIDKHRASRAREAIVGPVQLEKARQAIVGA